MSDTFAVIHRIAAATSTPAPKTIAIHPQGIGGFPERDATTATTSAAAAAMDA
jgi:hypothetical protein